MSLETYQGAGDYIGGAFTAPPSPTAELRVRSPADLADIVCVHGTSPAEVDRAVEVARRALPSWRRLGFEARAVLLKRYQDRLRANTDAIARAISREIGKPTWEARLEVGAMITKIDLSLGEGMLWTQDRALADLPGEIRFRPHGVAAVVGPFNFPGHLPNGHFVPALALGNTVVLKPSDKAPSVARLVALCFHEAGFPDGVFNVVQGGVDVAQALIAHEGVDAILFTGSVAVGKKIVAANLERLGRLVALELGGKNASIVLADADLERAAREIAFAGFVTAGQRCTATSRVIVERSVADALSDKLVRAAKSAVVGYPFDEGVFLGPVVNEGSRAQLFGAQARARAAGYEALAEGGAHEVPGHEGYYLRPSVHRAPAGNPVVDGYTSTELFGPDLAIYVVDSVEEATALTNATPYGLSAAVFTQDQTKLEHFADALHVGCLHWNRSSAGASSRLPFGGIKDSGNHRPAAIMAGLSCAYPLALLLPAGSSGAPSALPSWPGLSFEG